MQTAIVSVNSVNQLIFVMVKFCVFFAVRTEFGFKGLNSDNYGHETGWFSAIHGTAFRSNSFRVLEFNK
jgi:hypothetical protein